MLTVTHTLRLSQQDAHYGGQLVDGARVLALFGDVATELLIRHDGDEGLFRAYDSVDFLAPLYAGDFIEVTGTITKVGRTARTMTFSCKKIIQSRTDLSASAAEVLPEKIVTTTASGTCIVPLEKQRVAHE
ncbi:MAG: 3-aminobutyryl-CoA ammonia lyase [Acholeplasmatales bacterium]|nr:MAG: 3-aminobutyryl-CoA ammonia lyase [Acholeplasmatales bacterium]